MNRDLRSEAGSASAQVVFAMPALLLAVFLVFQFALYQHADHVATAAAQRGLTGAQGEAGSEAAGRRAAADFLARAASGLITSPEVAVSRGRERSRVTVSGGVVSLVPGLSMSVRASAEGASESFRARTER